MQRRTRRGLFLIPDATPPQLMALHRRAADDLDAELIADFLTHIETEWRNGARPKLRANTRAQSIVTVELQLGVRAAGSAS